MSIPWKPIEFRNTVLKHYGKGKNNSHILATPQGCNCKSDTSCVICEGGLGVCLICNAGEQQLDDHTCSEFYDLKADAPVD